MIHRVGLVLVGVVCFLGTCSVAQDARVRFQRGNDQGGSLPIRNNRGSHSPSGYHPLSAASFGFDCPYNDNCGATYRGGSWITTKSQPGTVRLWSSGTDWADLQSAANTYDWFNLDTWLDLVAEHQPRQVMYTFGHVPCFIAGKVGIQCEQWPNPWSPVPPTDLTQNGSPTFNAFVTALVNHCSSAGHCVKDYIKYWELWNEANLPTYWEGTPTQLYDMMKPAVAIIHDNIPGAIVSTPPVCGGEALWMQYWLNLENTNGRISDYYGFHIYMLDSEPETRMSEVEKMVSTKNSSGWTTTPWMNTETNWDHTTHECSSNFSQDDCNGQLVRWHVMQYAYQGGVGGAVGIDWYFWPSIENYDTYYYTMMQWLVGSNFTVSCSTSGNVWTCPLTESNGTAALVVWNATGNAQYKPGTQYVDYKEMNGTYGGTTVQISPGQTTTIGYVPIMFETD